MRNSRRIAIKNRGSVYQLAATNHDWLLFNFGETSGTTVSDRSGYVYNFPVSGTTTGLWSNSLRGITPSADNAIQFNSTSTTTTLLDRLSNIYKFDNSASVGRLQYIMFKMGINAAPATDTSNYLLSFGRQSPGGITDAYGQLSIRINANRIPNLELRKRGTIGSLSTMGAGTGATLSTGSPGSARTYLVLISTISGGVDLQVDWFTDASVNPTNSNSIVGGVAAGPLRNDAAGVVIMGKSSASTPFGPSTLIGSGSVSPIVDWIGFGACSDNPTNRSAIIESWVGYCSLRDMPEAFSRITR